MEELVSIIIPAYNAERWISDTIKSALSQTWSKKEIIIVDDGSTDRTVSIARTFESTQVTVLAQQNKGASAARNKGLSLAQGHYIQWLDADDLLAPDKITRQMEVAEQCGNRRVLLSSAWGRFMYRSNRAEFAPTGLWCDLSSSEWLLRKMRDNLHMQTATWLVSRELTEAAGPWDPRLSLDDDGEYFCRVLLKSDGVRFVPEAKVFYRISGNNSLSYYGPSNSKMDSLFLSMQLHIGYIRSLEESDRIRSACISYLQTSLFYFYPDRLDIVREAQQIASSLQGQLISPHLSWKYSWIKVIFGWSSAKWALMNLPAFRCSLARLLDRLLFWIENRKLSKLLGL